MLHTHAIQNQLHCQQCGNRHAASKCRATFERCSALEHCVVISCRLAEPPERRYSVHSAPGLEGKGDGGPARLKLRTVCAGHMCGLVLLHKHVHSECSFHTLVRLRPCCSPQSPGRADLWPRCFKAWRCLRRVGIVHRVIDKL